LPARYGHKVSTGLAKNLPFLGRFFTLCTDFRARRGEGFPVIPSAKLARLAPTRRIPHDQVVPEISSKGEARRPRLPRASVLEPPNRNERSLCWTV